MHFIQILQMEFRKLKRSYSWLLMFTAPLLMVAFGAYNFVRYKDVFLQGNAIPWEKLISQIVTFYGLLLLPLSIGVLAVWLARIEHAENNWKYLLTLPINRTYIYIAKTIIHILLVGLSMIILYVGIIIAGKLVSVGDIPYQTMFLKILSCWVTCLPLLAIQMILSIRFTNIGIPVGVGLAASIATIIISNSAAGRYYFWSFPYFSLLPNNEKAGSISPVYMMVFSTCVFIIVILMGCFKFRKQEVQ